MFFTRTHSYKFSASRQDLKDRLVGKHVRIHNLDFEVMEKDQSLSIIPHAEQVDAIKTLPITQVDFKEENGKTKVVITSRMRKLDLGGPMLVVIFCGFLLGASIVLFFAAPNEHQITYTLLGIGLFTFITFTIRMQMGYFDYVRKIRAYVKARSEAVISASAPVMAA
ncbi:MAG: hypothetical protein JWQ38_1465 [Flavipsychrobacter sp.]|nr:hypothetical protein [Flavipsychrobacter sp.]